MALWITDREPVELRPNSTEDDLQVVIQAAYKQVLGNLHIMDNQRLTSAESMLRDGKITVRGFVSRIAKSDLYRSMFFETSSPYRFVELNFKHLLGRGPADQAEISEHVVLYNEQGYDAELYSYLDSEEYLNNFGENIVPYLRGNRTQVGIKNVSFNRTFALMPGYATSDRGGQSRLLRDVAANLPTKIQLPARTSGAYNNTGKRFRITVAKAGITPVFKRTNTSFEASYQQLSNRIQSIQRTGGKILSIVEVS